MDNLKPCPFCGGEAEFRLIRTDNGNSTLEFQFRISCKVCRMGNYSVVNRVRINFNSDGKLYFDTDERERAIEAWNRRVNDET